MLYEYGNYLVNSNRFDEAGLMFIKAEMYSEALEAFKKCGNWKQGIAIGFKMKYSEEELICLGNHFSGVNAIVRLPESF